MKKNIAQQGRSMIEMLGVLGIIGVLTVGGFSLVNKATTSHKINNVIDDLGAFSNKTRTIFREYVLDVADGTTDDFNKYICEAKAYPETLEYPMTNGACDDNESFVNNDDVEFKADTFEENDMNYFSIKVSQLDEEMCMAISQTGWGSPAVNGYMGMCVGSDTNCGTDGSGVLSASETTGYAVKGGNKISLNVAASACGNNTNNQLFLVFR